MFVLELKISDPNLGNNLAPIVGKMSFCLIIYLMNDIWKSKYIKNS